MTNADLRLTPLGRQLGLVSDADWQRYEARRARLDAVLAGLHRTVIRPEKDVVARVEAWGGGTLVQPQTLAQLLCRPEVTLQHLQPFLPPDVDLTLLDADDEEELTTVVRYAGYVEREKLRQQKAKRLESARFPDDMDFGVVPGLSREARECLQRAAPLTLAQAARVPGVTPASVQVLSYWLAGPRHLRRRGERVTPDADNLPNAG
jgi:tRNA uridine 5-carboxymethylaminomethyl modification enzyme